MFPLSGGITAVGAFYLELELGTPQRTFRLQIDTVSHMFMMSGVDNNSVSEPPLVQ